MRVDLYFIDTIAEIELSAQMHQCLRRRIPTIEVLRAETTTWTGNEISHRRFRLGVLTAEDARVRHRWLYSIIFPAG